MPAVWHALPPDGRVNVLEQFPEHMFLVCWKCRIVKHTSARSTWKAISEAKMIEAPEKEDAA